MAEYARNTYNEELKQARKELLMDEQDDSFKEQVKAFDVSWKKTISLRELKQDLENARPFHDENMVDIDKWRELLIPADMKQHRSSKVQNPRSSVQPRLIRKMAEWRYSALTEPFVSNEDIFAANPRTGGDRLKAIIYELLINYQVKKELPFNNLIGQLVRALTNDGTAVLKYGWKNEVKLVDDVMQNYIKVSLGEKDKPAFEYALQLSVQSPSEFLSIPEPLRRAVEYFENTKEAWLFQPDGDPVPVKTYKTLVNVPSVEVFPVDHVIIDPACGANYQDAKFVIFEIETCIADLRKDGRYQNLDMINPNNNLWKNTQNADSDARTTFNYADPSRSRIAMYEYWGLVDVDGSGELKPIVVSWVGNICVRMEDSPFSDGKLPFITTAFMPKQFSPYGEPDAELLEDNQKVLGAVTRGIIDTLARNAVGQQGFAKGMLDPVNKVKFQRGEDYEFNPNFHPTQSVVNTQFTDIPQSAFEMVMMVIQDSESLTGVKTFGQGMSANSLGKVAASVQGMLDAAAKREGDILNRIADTLLELAQRIMSMNADFLEEEQFIYITDRKMPRTFAEDMRRGYDFKMSIMTAEETAGRSQELSFMLQTVAPNLDPSLRNKLMAEYMRISKMPDIADMIRDYQPEPDPMVQQMQQLQLQEQMLKVEQAKMGLTTAQVEAALTQAKTMTEQARAAALQGEADKAALDFVEQEKGVKQARDVEKITAQAEANIKMYERKAQLEEEQRKLRVLWGI